MSLKEIKGKVISYCEIPEELTEDHWLSEHYPDSYVQVHIDEEDAETDKVDQWIKENYPELVDEDYFFIHIDY